MKKKKMDLFKNAEIVELNQLTTVLGGGARRIEFSNEGDNGDSYHDDNGNSYHDDNGSSQHSDNGSSQHSDNGSSYHSDN